ncbi:MAG: NUDIX domain-containing protein [Planctomycetes bacterium]|nr:NUDIX domain-containing protein [Planctomycetota bacterium]
MSFVDRIAECNAHRLDRYVPLCTLDGARIGHVRLDRVEDAERGGLVARPGAVVVPGHDAASRTARLATLAAGLAGTGRIRPLHGELYAAVETVGGPALARVDRSVAAWLGIASTGVHVNGYVRRSNGAIDMWIARRAPDKATFPGQLDNLVAGGQPADLGYHANVVKECSEEAGIDRDLAERARAVGAISYVFENETGLKPDTMFCFDLELPAGFVPRPVDGEVESFALLPIDEVAALVRDTRQFKFNCNLVIIDFLLRHGLLDVDAPDFAVIADGLHRPLTRDGRAPRPGGA